MAIRFDPKDRHTIDIEIPAKPGVTASSYKIELRTYDPQSHVNFYIYEKGRYSDTTMSSTCYCIPGEGSKALYEALKSYYEPKAEAPAPDASDRKNYFIAVLSKDNQPRPSGTPKVFKTKAQAKAVALKMAEEHKGETFAVYEKTGEAHVPKPQPMFLSI